MKNIKTIKSLTKAFAISKIKGFFRSGVCKGGAKGAQAPSLNILTVEIGENVKMDFFAD